MERDLIEKIMEDVLFAREAADYLGISTQRLNQLVHSNQLEPIKKSNIGNLFLRQDLDLRKQENKSLGSDLKIETTHSSLNLETGFMYEAMNYFAIQSFFNCSDKQAEPIFLELQSEIDTTKEMPDIAFLISKKLDIPENDLIITYNKIKKSFSKLKVDDHVLKKGNQNYPKQLQETAEAPPYLFARGNIELLKEKIVSVVGSRQALEDGQKKAYRLSKALGRYNIVVASGLARGIDTAAHMAALDNRQMTIAVIGTSLTKAYPSENKYLQEKISEFGLVLSQFSPGSDVQRWHFPMRNAVMSGISLATVIVEAGETSGALKQADYALKQERLVFIPQSALDNDNISWPKKYINRPGAHNFAKIDELLNKLAETKIIKPKDVQISLFLEGDEQKNVLRLE